MLYYRASSIQAGNLEWQYPAFWLPPYGYAVVLIGSLAAMLLGAYLPVWKRAIPAAAEFAAATLVVVAIALAVQGGGVFQLRAAEWLLPTQAADFLQAHNV